jgi:hypothetical protein
VLVGTAVVAHYVTALRSETALGLELFAIFLIGLGLILIAGFWTPIAGGLIAVSALVDAFAHPVHRYYSVIVGVLGLALTLLGPGAWSVDARLFGWKRL